MDKGAQALEIKLRELANLLLRAGRGDAASLIGEEAGLVGARRPPRGVGPGRANALRAGLAAAADVADHLEPGAPERARLRALTDDIDRRLRAS